MDGWQWAGVNVKIERIGGEADASASSRTEKTRDLLKGVLERRYNIESKFLDLSTLRQDEQLKEQSIFDTKTTAGKFFPAMMRVLEGAFESSKDKDEAVLSVSLADNELTDLSAMSSLSQTLPKLKNLDLSNNKFEKLGQLSLWKKRFLLLEHLILTGNPIEQSEPDYAKSIIAWYPNLRNLNGIQVRSEEDIANRSKTPDIPFPIRSPAFQDEGGIAEGFVRTFIAGFDTDRSALTALYYDEQSDFSYSVNTAAPRDPTSTEQTEKQEWGDYIKNSRNLKKITQLPKWIQMGLELKNTKLSVDQAVNNAKAFLREMSVPYTRGFAEANSSWSLADLEAHQAKKKAEIISGTENPSTRLLEGRAEKAMEVDDEFGGAGMDDAMAGLDV